MLDWRRVLLLLLVVVLRAPAAAAAEPPACTSASAGSVACIAERLCRCVGQREGSMTHREAGYRWDCGPLRPYCHRPPALPRHGERRFDEGDLLLPLATLPRRRERPEPPDTPPGPAAE